MSIDLSIIGPITPIGGGVLILTWMVYDLIKDFIYNKDRSQNPFSKKEEAKENKSSINNSKKLKRASKRQ